MAELKVNLDFHKTFKPERNCLSSMLTVLSDCNDKTINEISQITGIPTGERSGKVEPTIFYLEYMGLISKTLANKKYSLRKTSLGDCLVQEDPGLTEELTLLLLHCYLCRPTSGAHLWGNIINNILPRYHNAISKANLDKELEIFYGKTVNMSPFNGTYTDLFDGLNLVEITDSKYVLHSHILNTEFIYLYGLILYEYWEEWFNALPTDDEKNNASLSEITANQLTQIGFIKPFGWNEQEEYLVLEALHDKGIIELNRQMVPFSIRRLFSKEEIVDALYSELC